MITVTCGSVSGTGISMLSNCLRTQTWRFPYLFANSSNVCFSRAYAARISLDNFLFSRFIWKRLPQSPHLYRCFLFCVPFLVRSEAQCGHLTRLVTMRAR